MNNISPKTIKLFLLAGDPTGAKKVQLSNWSGMAFVIPRNNLEIINTREELKKQCIYFLVGGTSLSTEVYIGETENFQKRIPQHQAKDFWNTCIIFLAKDENLSKAHIRFLESAFVEDCKKANRAKLHNVNSSEGSRLSEEDESEMNEFKENMKLVLSSLGYTFHEVARITDKIYSIKVKCLEAKGVYTAEGMIVLEGSQVAKEETPSIGEYLKNLRAEKLREQDLIDRSAYYEVRHKIIFSSLSTAAGFVMGRKANGWTEWKNNSGKTIDELERKNLEKKKK